MNKNAPKNTFKIENIWRQTKWGNPTTAKIALERVSLELKRCGPENKNIFAICLKRIEDFF